VQFSISSDSKGVFLCTNVAIDRIGSSGHLLLKHVYSFFQPPHPFFVGLRQHIAADSQCY
jgi:hypothetical protein